VTESEYVGSRVPLTSTHCQEGDEVNGMSWYLGIQVSGNACD
jgi:hypothetical protein